MRKLEGSSPLPGVPLSGSFSYGHEQCRMLTRLRRESQRRRLPRQHTCQRCSARPLQPGQRLCPPGVAVVSQQDFVQAANKTLSTWGGSCQSAADNCHADCSCQSAADCRYLSPISTCQSATDWRVEGDVLGDCKTGASLLGMCVYEIMRVSDCHSNVSDV